MNISFYGQIDSEIGSDLNDKFRKLESKISKKKSQLRRLKKKEFNIRTNLQHEYIDAYFEVWMNDAYAKKEHLKILWGAIKDGR